MTGTRERRSAAKSRLDMKEYRRQMAGIYSTSVNESTLDEAPMAYKSLSDIIGAVRESVDIIEILKPIYKAYQKIETVDPFLWQQNYDALCDDAVRSRKGDAEAHTRFTNRLRECCR